MGVWVEMASKRYNYLKIDVHAVYTLRDKDNLFDGYRFI